MSSNIELLLSCIDSYNNGEFKIKVKENETLKHHCSFRIGGNARVFAVPCDVEALIFLLREASSLNVRTYILGNGSNILFDDNGFDGVIISSSAFNKIIIDGTTIKAESGAMLSACALKAKENGLSGMECLFGIPGTIGGAVYMNAGAYGGEMSDITVKTRYIDLDTLTLSEVIGNEHCFGYRHSIFKDINAFILDTEMELKVGSVSEISLLMDDFKQRRILKQPLEFH